MFLVQLNLAVCLGHNSIKKFAAAAILLFVIIHSYVLIIRVMLLLHNCLAELFFLLCQYHVGVRVVFFAFVIMIQMNSLKLTGIDIAFVIILFRN